MTLYLALSCLQGRRSEQALDELLTLNPDGIQLTAGCVPPKGFKQHVEALGIKHSLHHNFDWDCVKRRIWDWDKFEANWTCSALPGASVHPMCLTPPQLQRIDPDRVWETMYPNLSGSDSYGLHRYLEVRWAMDLGLWLAVDIAHLQIMSLIDQENLVAAECLLSLLGKYERLAEVHVSAPSKLQDRHVPIDENTFGLGWAREMHQQGKLVVLESYMHKIDQATRENQLALIRGE